MDWFVIFFHVLSSLKNLKEKGERKIKDSRKKQNDKVIAVGGAQNAERWLKMKKRKEKKKMRKNERQLKRSGTKR